MDVKVLGKGCAKCGRLEELTQEALAELGIEAAVTHVRDMDAIMAYPIVSTPALVVNEEVKCSGRLPQKSEIIAWLREAQK